MTSKIYKHFNIQFSSESSYDEKSADNIEDYQKVYFEESDYRLSSIFGIKIFENDNLISSAIIGADGGATTIHETSFVISQNRIYICCGNFVFCLSIPELEIVWKTQADEITCFEIFKIENEFIIHGEMEISKLDQNGKLIWQRGGRDIFLTPEGIDDFSINDNIIIAKDFEYNLYEFDLDGNQIN